MRPLAIVILLVLLFMGVGTLFLLQRRASLAEEHAHHVALEAHQAELLARGQHHEPAAANASLSELELENEELRQSAAELAAQVAELRAALEAAKTNQR